jgi:hypothetical protein
MEKELMAVGRQFRNFCAISLRYQSIGGTEFHVLGCGKRYLDKD